MRHYHTGKWLLYKQNRVAPQERLLMEKHLERCEVCLQTYLNTVSEQEEELAVLLLPPDFNNSVRQVVRAKKQLLSRSRRSRILLHYITAASITLALVAGGVFDTITNRLPNAIRESGTLSRPLIDAGTTVSWPDWLMEATTTGINKLWQPKGGLNNGKK